VRSRCLSGLRASSDMPQPNRAIPRRKRASRQPRTGETARSRIAASRQRVLQTLDSKLDSKEQLGIPQSHKKPEKSDFCSSGRQALEGAVERDSVGRGGFVGGALAARATPRIEATAQPEWGPGFRRSYWPVRPSIPPVVSRVRAFHSGLAGPNSGGKDAKLLLSVCIEESRR
jgi:hypothetical protein